MQDTSTSLIARDDTMLGICQGIADDLGFNPLYLRIVLAVALFWNPVAVLGAYAALGVLVLFTRLLFPNPRIAPAAAAPEAEAPAAAAQPAAEPAEVDMISQQLLPLAA